MALAQVATTGVLTLATVTTVGTITNVQFHDPVSGNYVTTPLTLAQGQATSVVATGNNTATYSQDMQMVFVVTKPDGTQSSLNGVAGVTGILAGGLLADVSPSIVLDQQGVWTVEVKLMAAVAVVSLVYWIYYSSSLSNYQYVTPPTSFSAGLLSQLQYSNTGITWKNSSGFTVIGHVDLNVTRPDGVVETPSATSGQDASVASGSTQNVIFAGFTKMKGTYTLLYTVSVAGIPVLTYTVTYIIS